jgi:hypothetical protein
MEHQIATMALYLKDLLVCFDLCDKVITYAKHEGANLNTFTNIVSCAPLLLAKPYAISCYGHPISK